MRRSQRLTRRSNAAASPSWNAATSSSSVGAIGSNGLGRRRPRLSLRGRHLRARMGFLVDVQYVTRVHMGVALGGREAGMAEQLLDGPEVGPALQQMGGKAVAEGVWAQPAGDRHLLHAMGNDATDPPIGQSPTASVDEEGLGLRFRVLTGDEV